MLVATMPAPTIATEAVALQHIALRPAQVTHAIRLIMMVTMLAYLACVDTEPVAA